MSDNEQTTVTIEDVRAEPKRRPGRPRKDETIEIVSDGSEEKPKRTRRSSKLKGADVQKMFEYGSGTAVMLGAKDFWYINGAEVAPFSDEMAELLNRIPAQYVRGFFDFSGYLTIAIGLYGVVKPRLDKEATLREIAQNGHVDDDSVRYSVPR